jgi:hypothetical protein
MSRKFYALLLLAALAIAAGSSACIDTVKDFDKTDESAGGVT